MYKEEVFLYMKSDRKIFVHATDSSEVETGMHPLKETPNKEIPSAAHTHMFQPKSLTGHLTDQAHSSKM